MSDALTTEVDRRHWLRVRGECPARTGLQLDHCPAERSGSVQEQRSAGTATVGLAAGSHTELEAEEVVGPVLEVRTAAAEAALGAAELALPAGSWRRPPGTIEPKPPSLLVDSAVPEQVPAVLAETVALAEHTVQEVCRMPQLRAVELERT